MGSQSCHEVSGPQTGSRAEGHPEMGAPCELGKGRGGGGGEKEEGGGEGGKGRGEARGKGWKL